MGSIDDSDKPAAKDAPRAGLSFGMLLGSLIVVAGAVVYGFRLDRPPYQLTPLERTVELSLDVDPDLQRHRTLTLAFENTGRHPLKLAGVQTSCSCTVAGQVSGKSIAPGGVARFDVSVTLPAYDGRRTSLTVDTDPPTARPVTVSILMHGATLRTPYVNRMPKSFELTTRTPNEPVEHEITLETGEAADSKPWLTGLHTGDERATSELIHLETLPNEPAPGVVNRIYTFRMTMDGPASPYAPISFSITPTGMAAPVIDPEHCTASIVYRPLVRVFPERILVLQDETTSFPFEQVLSVSHLDEESALVITGIQTPAGWVTADFVNSETDSAEWLIKVLIDQPADAESDPKLVISLSDPLIPPVHIPIKLASVTD